MQSQMSQVMNSSQSKEERLTFLDVLKGLAIIAVICDHCKCWSLVCPLTFLPERVTYFSVSLFILAAGYTSAMSLERAKQKNISARSWIFKKVIHILCYYLIATAFCLFVHQPSHVVTFKCFFDACINFSAAPPLYFITFFLQLLCIAPLSYRLFVAPDSGTRGIIKLLLFTFVVVMSFFCIKYTRFGNIYGGGHFLFGGTYLIIYVLGQIIYIYRKNLFSKATALAITGVSFLFCLIFLNRHLIRYPLVGWINPPGFQLFSYAIAVFFIIISLFHFHRLTTFFNPILYPISVAGKYSLEIFLYHYTVIILVNRCFKFIGNGKLLEILSGEMYSTVQYIILRVTVGSLALIAYLFIPICGVLIYRTIKKYLISYSKGVEKCNF